MSDSRPVVVCLVGTDHHRFDRVIGWCDHLAVDRPDIEIVVQHGLSPAPTHAAGRDFFDKDELLDVLQRAHVAITHGGPGLISEVRSAGLLPLVVPRDPARGEHVDGHQQRFVARMDKSGLVEEVTSAGGPRRRGCGSLGRASRRYRRRRRPQSRRGFRSEICRFGRGRRQTRGVAAGT